MSIIGNSSHKIEQILTLTSFLLHFYSHPYGVNKYRHDEHIPTIISVSLTSNGIETYTKADRYILSAMETQEL